SATFAWTPGFCHAMEDSVEYQLNFTVTDNDSLSDDTTISIWVIDAGNELAKLGEPSWDSISIGGNQASIGISLNATDRDCDRIKFNGYSTSTANTILFMVPAFTDSIFVGDALDLDIYLSPFAEGLFYATLYIESDHNGANWVLSDSIKLALYVGDQVPPVGSFDPIIVSLCVVGFCNPVISKAEFNDIGSGIDSVYISYRQGNHVVPSQTKVLIPAFNVQTFEITDTIPNELFTIYGLELIYQSFDGANPPNSSYDTIQFSYDYHYDYSPTDAPYGRVENFVPPTLRTLFYHDFSDGTSELNKWTMFSIPGIIDSVYLRLDSLFRYDISNYAYNETSPGWRVYKRSLWETGESNGKYEIAAPAGTLENNQAYLYRRLDNGNVDERNERLYIPHGKVRDLNEINFDNIINYSNKQVWRFIGNPFPFPIRMDNLLGPSNIYKSGVNSIYAWNWENQNWISLPATGPEAEFNILQPYSGFICWPVNPGNTHLAIDPDWVYETSSNLPAAKNAKWEDLFTIRMALSTNGLTDNLQFGFKNDADQLAGWEDHFKFTSGFENRFIKFGINNFGWTSNAGIYAGDYRPLPGEGEVWSLMIYSSAIDDGSLVMMNWNVDDQLESGYEVWLFDKYSNTQINMRETASYSFKQVTDIEDERFEVITGTEYFLRNYLEQSSELLPLSFQLYQNYPNPFNPTTTIKFDLPNSGEVELSVFNVLGQKVKQIFQGVLIKGEHTLEWDGTDYNGTPTASGTYFYRLRTDQQNLTKKMILLR
ncbi:MAG: T9SS type A sorting domain-containing protein, partial [bacterium]